MNSSDREMLSAWVDDEVPDKEWSQATDRLADDEELKGCMERYRLIGAAIRQELPERIDPDMSSRIRAQLEQMEAPGGEVVSLPRSRPRIRPAGIVPGFAVAASVLVAAVAVFQVVDQPGSPEQTQLAGDTPQTVQPVNESPARFVSSPGLETYPAPSELDPYLANHVEQASGQGMSAVYPYARIAVYGDEE